MKLYKFYTIVLMIFLSTGVAAQTTTTLPKTTTPAKTTGNSSDSLKQAINNLKSLFGSKKDTICITITDIDYDDANLTALKDNLKNIKGVKLVTMQYKSSNAIIDVPYHGVATELWDKLSPDTKKPFKILEASNTSISLKYKNAITAAQ